MSDSQPMRIVVDSNASDRELAAITAAVMALNSQTPAPEAKAPTSPWREANKRESMRTSLKENRS